METVVVLGSMSNSSSGTVSPLRDWRFEPSAPIEYSPCSERNTI